MKLTKEELIKKIDISNPNRDYKVIGEFKGIKTPILVENKYGICSGNPGNLMRGCVPTIITAVDKTSYWINMAREKHGDTYDYSLVDYQGVQNKIKIICKIHREFEQKANDHIAGHGCKECGILNGQGYDIQSFIRKCKENFAVLYVICCWNLELDEEFFKFGITGKSVKERFLGKKQMPYEYEIFHQIEDDPESIYLLEQKLHKIHKEFKYKPKIDFAGKTECYEYFSPIPELYNYLEKYLDDKYSCYVVPTYEDIYVW